MKLYSRLVILFVSFFLVSCSLLQTSLIKKESTLELRDKVEACEVIAKIKNYSYQLGCQYLLELKDGTLLYPINMPDNIPFYDGAGVKIGYELIKPDTNDVTQTECKTHDYLANILCAQEYVYDDEGKPTDFTECEKINNPYKFLWMRDAIKQIDPKRINEYKYTQGFIYEFISAEVSHLYDCLGNEICSTKTVKDCQSLLETLDNPRAILVVNN